MTKDITLEEQSSWVNADLEDYKQKLIQEGLFLRTNENACKLLMLRLMNRGLNRSFDIEIVTLNGRTVPALNAP